MERWLKSIHDTVLDCGNSAALAEEVGLTRNDLMNRANPEIDRGHLHLIHYYRLLKATQDFRSLHLLANRFGFQLSAQPQATPAVQSPALLVAMLTAEMGDVAHAVADAMADDEITRNEELQISREIAALRKRADDLERSVAAKRAAGRGRRRG